MNRVSSKRLGEIEMSLNERDRHVLETLRLLRYCKTNQLQRLFFYTASTPRAALTAAMKVLKRLKADGLVDHLERRIGGAGGGTGAYIWFLTNAGERLLDYGKDKDGNRARQNKNTDEFIRRNLAVAEYYVRFTEICRMGQDMSLAHIEVNPLSLRSFIKDGKTVALRPDMYVEINNGKYHDHWFIEVDMGIDKTDDITNRVQKYRQYYYARIEQEKIGVFPVVLWIVDSEERKEMITNAVQKFHTRMNMVITPNQLWTVLTEGPKKEELI